MAVGRVEEVKPNVIIGAGVPPDAHVYYNGTADVGIILDPPH
jgi:hypothetical protein